VIDYPAASDERRILAETTKASGVTISRVASGADLEGARHLVRELPAADNVVDYALRLVRATRPADPSAPQVVREWVKWGSGPRAGQALLLGAKAAALADGRSAPSPDDVRNIALPVLRHRILLNFQAEADGIDADQVIGRLVEAVSP
jgi:MoxR-like ATPase